MELISARSYVAFDAGSSNGSIPLSYQQSWQESRWEMQCDGAWETDSVGVFLLMAQ